MRRETLRGLDFHRVLERAALFAHSGATREAVAGIVPMTGAGEIRERMGLVEELRTLSRLGVSLRLGEFGDIRPLLEELKPEGAMTEPADLLILLPVLRMLAALSRQLAYRSDIPLLRKHAGGIAPFPDLQEELETALDDEGGIRDEASPLLFDIRTRKRGLTARIRRRLEEIVRERQVAIFLQDDFITQRGGRWVIPVRMDSKGMVAGVVHDVSNSGETAFMEPLEIIPLANELENLAAEEKGEMIRIVREICRMVRSDAASLEEQFGLLIFLDMLNSIASLSDLLGAEVPSVAEEGELRIVSGRHPLLLLLQEERGAGRVVPLDLSLGGEESVMVITGPNAGGKTIALKTAGLLLLMALSGLPVPASSASAFPLSLELLVDIGDEQSLEQSLSTFAAHITNIAGILERADRRTVVLMDELGTGTEPRQGGALSCAVLSALRARGALVVATTHLTEIAGFVHRTAGMVNASMEYDARTLLPLYRLTKGEPGQSHALDIASRYGLPQRVVEEARDMLGRVESDFHRLLGELKESRARYEEELSEAERLRREAEKREEALREELAQAQTQRRETLEKAYAEAKSVIAAARREVNVILEEARRERSRASREKLAEAEREMERRRQELRPGEQLAVQEVREGVTVFVPSIGYDALVLSVDRRHSRARVRAGNVEMEVPLAGVALKAGKEAPAPEKRRRAAAPADEPSSVLNVIGFRADDALSRLESFLNDAALTAVGEVRIIHGVGTGALLRAVREHLARHPLVKTSRAGEQFEGGNGVTVATLR